jgi:hypothetical protein
MMMWRQPSKAELRPGRSRTITSMTNDARMEIRMPSQYRRDLDEMAAATGVPSGVLCRIGIRWLLDHLEGLSRLLPPPDDNSLRNVWPR